MIAPCWRGKSARRKKLDESTQHCLKSRKKRENQNERMTASRDKVPHDSMPYKIPERGWKIPMAVVEYPPGLSSSKTSI